MIPKLRPSLALSGLDPVQLGLSRGQIAPGQDRSAEVRSMILWARSQNYRGLQLDATIPGVRPRELDRSGRRDLAATIRRADLKCSGIDVWIPPEHFADAQHVDRAVAAVIGAIELARDLAMLAAGSVVTSNASEPGVVSLVLPDKPRPDVLSAIGERAQAAGVLIADHAWPVRESGWESLKVGLDPAALLARNEDPSAVVSKLGARIASARLPDPAASAVAMRATPVRFDLPAYAIALVTAGYSRMLVVDLRGSNRQAAAAAEAVAAIDHAVPSFPG